MFEIDFLAVGEETKSGDAIAGRFRRPDNNEIAVFAVDGGFSESGKELSNFIYNRYGTKVIDLLISTHPDKDHFEGIKHLLEQSAVRKLLMHRPALHGFQPSDDVKVDETEEMAQIAAHEHAKVIEPFAGQVYLGGAVTIAGPSKRLYEVLLSLPEATQGTKSEDQIVELSYDPGESMEDDNGGTSNRNNTSVVTDIRVGTDRALLTGDAGVPALNSAAAYLESTGKSSPYPHLFQIPHHGSRHNLDPELLDRLLGGYGQFESGSHSAVASVAAKANDYPRPEVRNAVKRRGYSIRRTKGSNFWWHRGDVEQRSDYSPAWAGGWVRE